MNVIEVPPLGSDVTGDDWVEDSHRIHEERRREHWDIYHQSGVRMTYGGIEEYMKHVRPELREYLNQVF